jgi:hypothetical protein
VDARDLRGAEFQESAAIMFIFLDGSSDGHTELWFSLREELARFRKPVVDIYRNSPPHQADEPFQTARGAFANLTSVVTGAGGVSGGEDVQWMKINVDTNRRGLLICPVATPVRTATTTDVPSSQP